MSPDDSYEVAGLGWNFLKKAFPKVAERFNPLGPAQALRHGTKIKGKLPTKGGPENGFYYRTDNKGNITSYAAYDDAGNIRFRTDMTGDAHFNKALRQRVETPHTAYYTRHGGAGGYSMNPSDPVPGVPTPIW